MTAKHTRCYVGKCPKCKGIQSAVVIIPAHIKDVQGAVRDMVRRDLDISTVTCEDVRASEWCECADDDQASAQLAQSTVS